MTQVFCKSNSPEIFSEAFFNKTAYLSTACSSFIAFVTHTIDKQPINRSLKKIGTDRVEVLRRKIGGLRVAKPCSKYAGEVLAKPVFL